MNEAEILDFVRGSLGSVWALEVLALMRREPERAWQYDELVRELRSSPAAVYGASQLLQNAGLIAQIDDRACRYQPATPALDHIGELVQKIYAAKPATVIGAIFKSPHDTLRAFAAAFRIKK